MAGSTQADMASAKQTRPKRAVATPQQPTELSDGASAESVVTGAALTERSFDAADRDRMVAEAAYYRAEQRGFAPGHELEDWIASEADIDAYLYRLYGEGRSF